MSSPFSSPALPRAEMEMAATRVQAERKQSDDDAFAAEEAGSHTRALDSSRAEEDDEYEEDEDQDLDDDEDDDGGVHTESQRRSAAAPFSLPLPSSSRVLDAEDVDTDDEEERITAPFHEARASYPRSPASRLTRRTSRQSASASSLFAAPRYFSLPFQSAASSRTSFLGLHASTWYYMVVLPLLLLVFAVIPFILVLVFYLSFVECLVCILFALTPQLLLYYLVWKTQLAGRAYPAFTASASTADRAWLFLLRVHRSWQQEAYQLLLTLLSCTSYIVYTYNLSYSPDAASPSYYDYVLLFTAPAVSVDIFIQVEYFLIVSFSLDYLLGFFVSVKKWGYALSYYRLVDLLCFIGVAYFSFFHRGFAPQLAVYNYYLFQGPLRFMRMRRALKGLDRPVHERQGALIISKQHALLLLVSFRLFLYLMSAAALVLAAEFPCQYAAPSSLQHLCTEQLQSFHLCVYFVVISISTVGYGDITCITTLGRMLMIFVVIGALVQLPAELEAWKDVQHSSKLQQNPDHDGKDEKRDPEAPAEAEQERRVDAVEAESVSEAEDGSSKEGRAQLLLWCEEQLMSHLTAERLQKLCQAMELQYVDRRTVSQLTQHSSAAWTLHAQCSLRAAAAAAAAAICAACRPRLLWWLPCSRRLQSLLRRLSVHEASSLL